MKTSIKYTLIAMTGIFFIALSSPQKGCTDSNALTHEHTVSEAKMINFGYKQQG